MLCTLTNGKQFSTNMMKHISRRLSMKTEPHWNSLQQNFSNCSNRLGYIEDSNHLIYSFRGEVYRRDYQTILNECFFPLPPGNYSIKIYSFDSFSNWIICEANFTINNSDTTFVAKFYAIKIFQTAYSIPLLLNLCLTLGYLATTSTHFIKKSRENC